MDPLREIAAWLASQPALHVGLETQSLPGPGFRCTDGDYLSFSSNNYLGLANSPRLKAAAHRGLDLYGVGNCESRLLTGDLGLYRELEARLAALKKKQAAVLFATGYLTNLGVLSALVRWPIMARVLGFQASRQYRYSFFSDEFNHVSIKEGIRLSGVTAMTYRHLDLDDLERKLRDTPTDIRIIVSDGVFSQDGDIAPLPQLLELAERYDAAVYLDDAHGTGVLGPTGAGTSEHFNLESPRLIQMGTLSKAYGAIGGFVACDALVAEILRLSAQAYGFTSTLPPDQAMAVLEAMSMVVDEPERRERLWSNQRYAVSSLQAAGVAPLSSNTPILPVPVGDERRGEAVAQTLRQHGMHVDLVKFPAVGLGRARLRVIVNSGHTPEQIDSLVDLIREELAA